MGRPPVAPNSGETPPAALPHKAGIFSIIQGDGSGALPSHARKRATRRQFPSSCDLTRAKTPPPKASPSSQLPLPISPNLQHLQLRRQRCPTRRHPFKFDGESDPTLISQSLLQSLLSDATSPILFVAAFFLPLFDVRRATISVSTPRVPPNLSLCDTITTIPSVSPRSLPTTTAKHRTMS